MTFDKETKPKDDTYDSRPLFVFRIYDELLSDKNGRRYRRGAAWQFQSKKKSDESQGEIT